MYYRKFFILCGFLLAQTSSAMKELNEIEGITKVESMYMSFVKKKEYRKSTISNLFNKNEGNLGVCAKFNLAVMFIIQKDHTSLDIVFDGYEKSKAFLECTSDKNKKTILHHLMENIDKDNFVKFMNYTYRVLNWHPDLKTKADQDGNIPFWYLLQNELGTTENILMKNLMSNYGQFMILPKSRTLAFVEYNDYKSIQEELKNYNPKKDNFLLDFVNKDAQQTLAHCIVMRMDKNNFDDNFCILKTLITYHPELANKVDANARVPLNYMNNRFENQLTGEQMQKIMKLLTTERCCSCLPPIR